MNISKPKISEKKGSLTNPRKYFQSRQKEFSQTHDDLEKVYFDSQKKHIISNSGKDNSRLKDEKGKGKDEKNELQDSQDLEINYNEIDPNVVRSRLKKQGIKIIMMRFKQVQDVINQKREVLKNDVQKYN